MKSKVLIIRSTSIFKDSRTIKLINELLSLGYEVEILGWDRQGEYGDSILEYQYGGNTAKIYLFKRYCPYGAGLKNIFNFVRFRSWIKKQVKGRKDDYIIHSCDFDTGDIAYRVKKNKKFIYDIFDYYSESRNLPKFIRHFFAKRENSLINKSDAVVICSEQRKVQIAKSKPKKLFIIHNSPNIEDVKDIFQLKSNSKKIKVAYVGVLAENRLLKEIFDASKNYENIELHIGGLGVYKEYIQNLEKKQSNIYFYGSMNYQDVLALEKKCDVLFATYNPKIANHKYSAPNKFYEAGALSKPIIVCEGTGIDEPVKEYNTGLVVKYNADEFYSAVNYLSKNQAIMKKLGNQGHKAYIDYFSWDEMKKRIKNLYEYVEKL
ncbi:MAG: glycosyltransferase family 4 protein [Christensenellales bacterium]